MGQRTGDIPRAKFTTGRWIFSFTIMNIVAYQPEIQATSVDTCAVKLQTYRTIARPYTDERTSKNAAATYT
jgi:hypothetical protein